MRTAATLLASAQTIEGMAGVIRAARLASDRAPLDDAARAALGIHEAGRAELAGGPGNIRVLLLELSTRSSLREALQRQAARLAVRAPHVLWFVAAVEPSGSTAAIIGWPPGGNSPRVASLSWEPARVVDSDAETLCALSAVSGEEDVLRHARAVDVLGRDALTRRFYRALETRVGALAAVVPARQSRDDARAVALLYCSRLLFLSFLEAKGWLDADRAFISSRFDECMRAGGRFHDRVLLPLFFGTLNTPNRRRARAARAFGRIPFLNGGLFARSAVENRMARWRFPDEEFGSLLSEVFQRFRFVAQEDSATWSEASIDPEMLGRAFESLMASGERRDAGVYYTPHALVARVTDKAFDTLAVRSLRDLRELRVLDPACGSGAFLVHALERIAELRREAGDPLPVPELRRAVLSRSIFGVDRNTTAVWLCELRLWLSVVIESREVDPDRVPPLPNLDRNIRVGDSLGGAGFATAPMLVTGGARMADLRARYVRATGGRKRALVRTLDREERKRAVAACEREIAALQYARRERLLAQRSRDLFGGRSAPDREARRESKRLRDRLRVLRADRRRLVDGGALPFSFGACFAEVQARGGFDLVIGNPPWVRLHRIPAVLREDLKRGYEVYRAAAWSSGAKAGGAAPGFASQVDLAALFVERAAVLLRDGGVLGLLLPAKLWRSLAGGGVRQFLGRRAQVTRLEDLSESRHAFDAAVYPSLLVARSPSSATPPRDPVTLAVHDRSSATEWILPAAALAFDETPGAPWLLLPPRSRAAFDIVSRAGTPLTTRFGAPRLGVKSGCNVAFLVRVTDAGRELASVVDADGERGSVELQLLRPALRGDGVKPWRRGTCDEWIIWTHDARGAPLARLPDRTRTWLRRRYDALATRSDAARAPRWWSLFRVDAGDATRARLVWSDFGRRPRALVLPAGDPAVPLNTCYVMPFADECDAWALAAILNSRLAAAWLNAIAEQARGGYRRYLGWTVGLLPIPGEWPRVRTALARAAAVACDDDSALLSSVLLAYGIDEAAVAPLLEYGA